MACQLAKFQNFSLGSLSFFKWNWQGFLHFVGSYIVVHGWPDAWGTSVTSQWIVAASNFVSVAGFPCHRGVCRHAWKGCEDDQTLDQLSGNGKTGDKKKTMMAQLRIVEAPFSLTYNKEVIILHNTANLLMID